MEVFLTILFLLSFLLQILLLGFLFPRLLFQSESDQNDEIKGISVVIAAHNELENLKNLIPCIQSQVYPNFEIIVAIDRSDDGSEEYLKSLMEPRLKVVSITETPGDYNPKKYALYKAIECSHKEIILLTDADCIPLSNGWIREMNKQFKEETDIVLGYSPYKIKNGILNLIIRFETLLTGIQYLSFAKMGWPYMGVGRNLGYKKQVFVKNSGFNEIKNITGGDDDLFIGKVSTNKNCSIIISKNSQVQSIPKTSWNEYFRQKTRHLSVGKKYSFANKLKSGLYPTSQLLLYYSTISLFYFNANISYIGGTFILRTLVLIIIFALITRKLGDTIRWFWVPLLDLLFAIIYVVTGISAMLSKNIKWK